MPCRSSAASSAADTGPAVARRTSVADTPNREESSIPEIAFRRQRAAGQMETADDIHLPQLHRPGPLPTPIIRPAALPLPGAASPLRTNARGTWSGPAPGRSHPC